MIYTTRIVDGINIAYSEIGEFEFFIPEGMTGADFKIWKEANLKDLKEAKAAMKEEMKEKLLKHWCMK